MRADRLYAEAEASLDGYYEQRRRRGPPLLLATLLTLTLAVGAVTAVDLRRLQTPRGTALAWTGAAVFGDCTAYDRLSVAPSGRDPDRRDGRERCLALRTATQESRDQPTGVAIELGAIVQRGSVATAVVTVTRRNRPTARLTLDLRRQGRGWTVVRTPATCAALGCA